MLKRVCSSFLAASLLVCLLGAATNAQSDPMHDGLAKMSAGEYAEAQRSFEDALKKSPKSAQAHYCLAVCYHYQNQYALAVKEYSWVCKNTTQPDLLRRANKGLAAVEPLAKADSASMKKPAAAPGAVGEAVEPGKTPQGNAGASQPAPAAATTDGKARIMVIYSESNGSWQSFEPIYLQAVAKYSGKITFEKIDADAPENRMFCQANHITTYPTILMMDGKGQAVDAIKTAPSTFADFQSTIERDLPGL